LTSGRVTDLEFHLSRIIRLLKPVDNTQDLSSAHGVECMADQGLVLGSPVQFEWEPLGDRVTYRCRARKGTCPQHHWSGTIAEQTTSATPVAFRLPGLAANEYYVFTIHATRDGRTVGMFTIHGRNYLGWDLRFKVR